MAVRVQRADRRQPTAPVWKVLPAWIRPLTYPTPPGGGSLDRMAAMRNVAIPLPPVVSAALPSQPPPINNLERMRMAAIPVPPSAVPAPNMDRLEQMCNAAIPHPPLSPINNLERMRMVAIPTPPSCGPSNSSSTIIEHGNGGCMAPAFIKYRLSPAIHKHRGRRQSEAALHDYRGGHKPGGGARSQEICLHQMSSQALEQAGLATSDADDNFLASPPQIFPTDTDLDGHIVQAMRRISADIRQLVRSRVQHVEAGQYTVDMIDLLEVSRHPHVGYSLEPYTGGPPYPSRQSAIEMAIVYLGCRIECMVIHLLGMPRPSDWPAEWYGNLRLDMEELDHLILVTISRESFSPLLPACYHAYLRCKEDQARFQDEVRQIPARRLSDDRPDIPLHSKLDSKVTQQICRLCVSMRLSMGDRIDEWMEEKVSAYMIAARSAAGRTYGVKYIMEFQLTDYARHARLPSA
ncbi:hypothetical protein EDD16DRAFT_1528870 [Pisolithus croceorrhizus]|nr:hypothetical protein EDD16DRAFT_1528870 [Pisolithus croceorrhizus]